MNEAHKIDFVISNPGHHLEASLAVIASLQEMASVRCRVLSLCELRGKATPQIDPMKSGATIHRLVPRMLRRPRAVERPLKDPRQKVVGNRLRTWSWRLLLGPGFRRYLGVRPDVVVVPNDAAYPYDRLAELLRRQGRRFLLLQEGIRFPLPAEEESVAYGSGGANAIAAWGETSAQRFRDVGVPGERIHKTGSPRFDGLSPQAWDGVAEEIRQGLDLGKKNLLLLTNPIDAQGFCSKEEKLALVARFASSLMPLYGKGYKLLIKTHWGENADEFRSALAAELSSHVQVLTGEPLYGLFRLVDGAVVLASTVGLEAQRFGLPLGVLEIPGSGFVHDYVSSGAALGLNWRQPMDLQVEELLGPWASVGKSALEDYLERSLTASRGASDRVARLIVSLAEEVP